MKSFHFLIFSLISSSVVVCAKSSTDLTWGCKGLHTTTSHSSTLSTSRILAWGVKKCFRTGLLPRAGVIRTEGFQVRGGSRNQVISDTKDKDETGEESESARNDKKNTNDLPKLLKLFPIHQNEMKKFLLMGAIKFFIIIALTLTRDTKDTMIVTQCGAEAIAFLKVRSISYLAPCHNKLTTLSSSLLLYF